MHQLYPGTHFVDQDGLELTEICLTPPELNCWIKGLHPMTTWAIVILTKAHGTHMCMHKAARDRLVPSVVLQCINVYGCVCMCVYIYTHTYFGFLVIFHLFLIMCLGIFPAWMLYDLCAVPVKVRRGCWILWTGLRDDWQLPCGSF